MNKVSNWIVTFCVGLITYIIFFIGSFPVDQLIVHLAGQVEKNTGGQYKLAVGEIDGSLFFKSKIKNFKVFQKDDGEFKPFLDFQEVSAGVHLIPALFNTLSLSFESTAPNDKEGRAEGSVTLAKDEASFEIEFKKFGLHAFPFIPAVTKIPVNGKVTGNIDLELDSSDHTKSEGEINLKFNELYILETRFQAMPGMDLDFPKINLSGAVPSEIKLEMKKSKIDLKKFEITGDDLKMTVKGNLAVNKKFLFSRVNLDGSFSLSERLAQTVTGFLGFIEKQKREDGSYPFTLTERLSDPSLKIGDFDLTQMKNMMAAPME